MKLIQILECITLHGNDFIELIYKNPNQNFAKDIPSYELHYYFNCDVKSINVYKTTWSSVFGNNHGKCKQYVIELYYKDVKKIGREVNKID